MQSPSHAPHGRRKKPESPNDKPILLYIVSGLCSELDEMRQAHSSLTDNSQFTALYNRVLTFYETHEDIEADTGCLGKKQKTAHARETLREVRRGGISPKHEAKITLERVRTLYESVITSIREIVDSQEAISIGERALRVPRTLDKSFNDFKAGIERSTAEDFFEEAVTAAKDSLILAEITDLDKIIESMRKEVAEKALNAIDVGLSQFEGDDPDSVNLPDTDEVNDEILRLMTLTDDKLRNATTELPPVVKEIILTTREDIRDGFSDDAEGPQDAAERRQWAERITIKERPAFVVISGEGKVKSSSATTHHPHLRVIRGDYPKSEK